MLSWATSLVKFYSLLILARVIISWIPEFRSHAFTKILDKITDPFLKPFRDHLPPVFGGIDISPMVAMICLQAIESLLRFFT